MIECHFIGWNIEDTIQFTIKHYKSFCDRVIYYDNYSDDRSREIANDLGAEVKQFGIPGVLDDREYKKLKDNCWKGSNADWVIVCDNDEILQFQNVPFEDCTIIRTQGFNMYSESMPVNSWFDIKTGFKDENYSKFVCFDPKRIKEINYVYGCHVANPVGHVVFSNSIHPLYHYHAVGGIDRMLKRHRQYVKRLCDYNNRWGLGHHYKQEEERKRREWKESSERSETLLGDGIFLPSILTRLTQRQEE